MGHLGSRYTYSIYIYINHKIWAPTSYKWSYNPYKWPYKWITDVITLLDISLLDTIISR